jgi:nucleoid-associated protein YgaU
VSAGKAKRAPKGEPKAAEPAKPDPATASMFGAGDAEAAAKATVDGVNATERVDTKTGEVVTKPALMRTFEDMAARLELPLTSDDLRQAKGVKGDFLFGAQVLKELNSAFGRGGWSSEIKSVNPSDVHVDEKNEVGTSRVVRRYSMACWAHVRFMVGAPSMPVFVKEDVGVHHAEAQPTLGQAYDLAIKGSVTDGIKRCASQVADRFGLVLRFKEDERASEGLLGPTKDDERPPVKPKPTSSPSTSAPSQTSASDGAKASAGSSAAPSPGAAAASTQATAGAANASPATSAAGPAGDVKLDPKVQVARWLLEGKLPTAVTKLIAEGHGPESNGLPEGVVLPDDPGEEGLACLKWTGTPDAATLGRLDANEPVAPAVLNDLYKSATALVGGDVKRLFAQLGVQLAKGVKVSGYQARLFAASVAKKGAK